MAWFEIRGNEIWSNDSIPDNPWGTSDNHIYGIRLGGKWCIDYTFKLMFDISSEDWHNRFENIRTDQDFYDICEWLGVYYMKQGTIYRKGEKYDKHERRIQ